MTETTLVDMVAVVEVLEGAGTAGTPGQGGAGLAYPDFAGPLYWCPWSSPEHMRQVDLKMLLLVRVIPIQLHNYKNGTGNGGGHNQAPQPGPSLHGSDGIVIIRYQV